MRKLFRVGMVVLLLTAPVKLLIAQNRFFRDAGENALQVTSGKRMIIPDKFRAEKLNSQGMKTFLSSLPSETSLGSRQQAPIIELPLPEGSNGRFRVWESSIMDPALAARYPEIKTYLGQGIDDPYATVRFDYNPYFGFSAQILSIKGNIYIDPYARGDVDNYISYYTRDNRRNTSFFCDVPTSVQNTEIAQRIEAGPCRGTQLYSYRLAVACTGEYAVAVCAPSMPTVNATLAAIVTSVNRVTGIYESELSVRLVLIANENLLINLDPTGDPYNNSNPGNIMLSQNQDNIDAVIGTANYDIGHVFSTGGGGVAGVGVVCTGSTKGYGVTGTANPVGDNYDIDYVAHEMGHQFGAHHSFNGTNGSCGGATSSSSSYEVGSGTTIMCYAGICGSDNIQPHSDPYFHSISFDEIGSYVQTGGSFCRVLSATGNTLPVITAMNNNGVSIPISTPFTLTGAATDADGDALTYSWEEWDLGPNTTWNGGNANTTSPLFKSRLPKTTGSRTFPDIAVILAGYPANPVALMAGLKGETLPTVARALKFRLMVRDNRAGGGGVVTGGDGCQSGFTSIFQINTVATSGPFALTAPNGGQTFSGGSSQTVTWNVVGTNNAPINCANVRISISTDGGVTYPTVLLASTPNDGSESVTLPVVLTSTARIKVEAVGNIFFDISNANFSISATVPSFDFDTPAPANIACPPPASASITLGSVANFGFTTAINLSASGAPAGTSVSFGSNPLTPGNSTSVTLNNTNLLSSGSYPITVTGVAGAITRTRILTFNIQAGAPPVINTQPSTQNICVGSPVTFSVVATGATSYQWQLSTDGGGSFNNIVGATASSYGILSVQLSHSGQYRSIVTGPCDAITSSAATLNVQTLPAITASPQTVVICTGSSNTFNAAATGTNITLQWQLSTDGGTNFNNIPSATSSSYTVNGVTLAMNGYRYRIVATGTCAPPAVSNAATLTVVAPVAITLQPQDDEVCSEGNINLNVSITSDLPANYQWQVSTNGGANFTNLANGGVYSGVTSGILAITGATVDLDGNLYRVVLSNAACTTPTISTAAALTVRQRPNIDLVAAPLLSLSPGQSTTLTATPSTSTGGDITIEWILNSVTVPNTGNTRLVTVEETGVYQVQIDEAWPGGLVCTNVSDEVTIAAPGSNRLFIFPTPNTGEFTVAYFNSNGSSTTRTVNVFDAHGARVHQERFTISGSYTLLHINIKPAQGGIYIVDVRDANGKKLADGKVLVH